MLRPNCWSSDSLLLKGRHDLRRLAVDRRDGDRVFQHLLHRLQHLLRDPHTLVQGFLQLQDIGHAVDLGRDRRELVELRTDLGLAVPQAADCLVGGFEHAHLRGYSCKAVMPARTSSSSAWTAWGA